MIRFEYKAYDGSGRLIEGEIVSDTRDTALDALHRRGEFPIEVFDGKLPRHLPWWQREVFATKKISARALSVFMRELTTLVKAELPLDEALRIVALQPLLSPKLRALIRAVLERVLEGQSLSQSLAAQGDAFPEFAWRLIQAGETSGRLGDVLDDLAEFLERSAQTRAKVTSALLYPMILVIAAFIAVCVIMAVLLPAVVPLLEDAQAPMPFIIRVLEGIRETVVAHWLLMFAATAAVFLLSVAVMSNPAVRHTASKLALRVPLIGSLVTSRETARFARTLATLMKAGVPMLEAIRISGSVLKNLTFQKAILEVGEQVREGATLTHPLNASGIFPELAVRLIAVGEKTGQLDTMLTRVADIFEATLRLRLERLTSLLTPVLTLVIGLLIGWLIVSVMGALLSINQLAFN